MSKFKVVATAPTAYQYNSLSRFGMTIKKNGNGSFSSEQTFDSVEEAKAYLVERAEMYYDEYEGQVDEHLGSIEKHGCLEIDAVTAHIEEVPEYVVAIYIGDNVEYPTGMFSINGEVSKLIDNAKRYDSEDSAGAVSSSNTYRHLIPGIRRILRNASSCTDPFPLIFQDLLQTHYAGY